MRVAIVGAGIGALAAALKLAKAGAEVTVYEGSETAGGLAKGVTVKGESFDAGPYVLLDQPGLKWAFEELDLNFDSLHLHRIHNVYSVQSEKRKIELFSDLNQTADQLGSEAQQYREFVGTTYRKYQQVFPYTFMKPNPWKLLRDGKWGLLPFLTNSLGQVMNQHQLSPSLQDTLGIWTHIAAQSLNKAPSPMAFVPGLIHHVGAYYPAKGISAIPELLYQACKQQKVNFRFQSRVEQIVVKNGRVSGLQLESGELVPAEHVISNSSAIGTYVNLIKETPSSFVQKIKAFPLQSPGICVFLKIKGNPSGSYVKFQLEKEVPKCKSLIVPNIVLNHEPGEWKTARLVFPLPHSLTQEMTATDYTNIIAAVLEEEWWKDGILDYEVLGYHTPESWGKQYLLYEQSMNPVMTAKFMRMGRMQHKSPYFKGLYFCGSSTHPGQWVSFCAISGILTATQLIRDA